MISKTINNQQAITNAVMGDDDNSITTINGNLLIQDSLGNSQTITPTGILPLINSTFNNIIVNPNYNISESGTGIISQTGTGTNILKQSQFTNSGGANQILIKDVSNNGSSTILQNGSSLSINSVTNNASSQTSLLLNVRNPSNGGVVLFNGNSTQLYIGNATTLYLTGGTNSNFDYTNTNISGVLALTSATPPTSIATQPAYTDNTKNICTTNWTQGAIMNTIMTSYPSLTMPSTDMNTLNINNRIILTDGTTTNTLSNISWTGAIATKNEIANTTHYLNFSNVDTDSIGWPQKNSSLSCNPAIGNITAATFTGAATQSYLNTSIAIGPNYIPFTTGGTSGAQALSTNSNLSYNASTGALTSTSFVGTATTANNVLVTSDNTSGTYFIPFVKSTTTSSQLFVDDTATPLSYNPSTAVLSTTTFSGAFTGALSGNATTASNLNLASTATTATLTGGILAWAGLSSKSFGNSILVLTGTAANVISSVTFTLMSLNSENYLTIYNGSTAALTIPATISGINIKITHNAIIPVPSLSSVLVKCNTLNLNGATWSILDFKLLY